MAPPSGGTPAVPGPGNYLPLREERKDEDINEGAKIEGRGKETNKQGSSLTFTCSEACVGLITSRLLRLHHRPSW